VTILDTHREDDIRSTELNAIRKIKRRKHWEGDGIRKSNGDDIKNTDSDDPEGEDVRNMKGVDIRNTGRNDTRNFKRGRYFFLCSIVASSKGCV
jgi:hypothetical protein